MQGKISGTLIDDNSGHKVNAEIQYSAHDEEIEIYIGGYFLASTTLDNISDQAFYELTGAEKNV